MEDARALAVQRALTGGRRFSFEMQASVPNTAGVYAGWLTGNCFYVGIASNLRNRIRSHFAGQRGGDQFCLLVGDAYVPKESCAGLLPQACTRAINQLTRSWIRENVTFSFESVSKPRPELMKLERVLKSAMQPLLNPE